MARERIEILAHVCLTPELIYTEGRNLIFLNFSRPLIFNPLKIQKIDDIVQYILVIQCSIHYYKQTLDKSTHTGISDPHYSPYFTNLEAQRSRDLPKYN